MDRNRCGSFSSASSHLALSLDLTFCHPLEKLWIPQATTASRLPVKKGFPVPVSSKVIPMAQESLAGRSRFPRNLESSTQSSGAL